MEGAPMITAKSRRWPSALTVHLLRNEAIAAKTDTAHITAIPFRHLSRVKRAG